MNRSIAIVLVLFAVLLVGWYLSGERDTVPVANTGALPQASVTGADPSAPASASSVGR